MGQIEPADEEVSGRETNVYKVFLPMALLMVSFIAWWQVAFVTGFKGGDGPSLLQGCGPLIFAGLVCWVSATHFWPLKRVWLTPRGLRVSNYRTEVVVPFAAIERITRGTGVNFRPVVIELREATPWGNRLMFVPRNPASPWAFAGEEDSVVRRLRARVDEARRTVKPLAPTPQPLASSPMADADLDGPFPPPKGW